MKLSIFFLGDTYREWDKVDGVAIESENIRVVTLEEEKKVQEKFERKTIRRIVIDIQPY